MKIKLSKCKTTLESQNQTNTRKKKDHSHGYIA